MPRLRKNPEAERDKAVIQMISYYSIARDCEGAKNLCKRLNVCEHTVRNRLNSPGDFTLAELRRLKSSLQIPVDDMVEYLRRAL